MQQILTQYSAVQCICGPNNRHIINLGLLIQCGKDVLMVDKQES